MSEPALSREVVRAAIGGDALATRKVVSALLPVVRVRVARTLYRFRRSARGRALEQEVDDLAQEVFVELFEHDAKVLASWEPSRGMTLTSFVSLVATRTATQRLLGKGRSPWTEDPTEDEGLDRTLESSLAPDARVLSKESAERLVAALRAELSPLGFRVFVLVFVNEADVETACAELGMTPDAVYAWRSRIAKTIRKLAGELDVTAPAE